MGAERGDSASCCLSAGYFNVEMGVPLVLGSLTVSRLSAFSPTADLSLSTYFRLVTLEFRRHRISIGSNDRLKIFDCNASTSCSAGRSPNHSRSDSSHIS